MCQILSKTLAGGQKLAICPVLLKESKRKNCMRNGWFAIGIFVFQLISPLSCQIFVVNRDVCLSRVYNKMNNVWIECLTKFLIFQNFTTYPPYSKRFRYSASGRKLHCHFRSVINSYKKEVKFYISCIFKILRTTFSAIVELPKTFKVLLERLIVSRATQIFHITLSKKWHFM